MYVMLDTIIRMVCVQHALLDRILPPGQLRVHHAPLENIIQTQGVLLQQRVLHAPLERILPLDQVRVQHATLERILVPDQLRVQHATLESILVPEQVRVQRVLADHILVPLDQVRVHHVLLERSRRLLDYGIVLHALLERPIQTPGVLPSLRVKNATLERILVPLDQVHVQRVLLEQDPQVLQTEIPLKRRVIHVRLEHMLLLDRVQHVYFVPWVKLLLVLEVVQHLRV
jgi:hypothetical protein